MPQPLTNSSQTAVKQLLLGTSYPLVLRLRPLPYLPYHSTLLWCLLPHIYYCDSSVHRGLYVAHLTVSPQERPSSRAPSSVLCLSPEKVENLLDPGC